MSSLQIIGTNKCQATRAAVRFFKERRIPFHFVDLNQRELSPGELQNIARAVGWENMLDREGPEYRRLGLEYQKFDTAEKLRENQKILRTPVVRLGSRAAVGYCPEDWKEMASLISSDEKPCPH